jgi:hypothetical protein
VVTLLGGLLDDMVDADVGAVFVALALLVLLLVLGTEADMVGYTMSVIVVSDLR